MFTIRYLSMPISNKPLISNVLLRYLAATIEESSISASKSYIDIEALCFDIECHSILYTFDIEALIDSSGPGMQSAIAGTVTQFAV